MKLEMLIFLMAMIFSKAVLARGTETSGGGGNGAVAEFVRLASSGLEALDQQGTVHINSRVIDTNRMGQILVGLQIQPTDQPLVLDGKSVTAINYPDQSLVSLYVPGWSLLDDASKVQLAFHELWGLFYHDHADDSYQYSTAMFNRIVSAGFGNPARVIAVVTTNQNGRGQTFRALAIRQGGQDNTNIAIVIEKLQEVSDNLDIVTSSIMYSPNELPYGTDSTVEGLKLDASQMHDVFAFKSNPFSTIGPAFSCELDVDLGPDLTQVPLSCHKL